MANCFQAWGLPALEWSVADTPSDTPLEKTDFPLASRDQFKIASRLGLGPWFHFPLSGHILLEPVRASVSMGSHVHWSCCV